MAKATAAKKTVTVTLELSEAEARTVLALCVRSAGSPTNYSDKTFPSPRGHADAVKVAITDALGIDRTHSYWYNNVPEFNLSEDHNVWFKDYPDNHPGIKGD